MSGGAGGGNINSNTGLKSSILFDNSGLSKN